MIDRSERIRQAITDKGLSYAELEKLTGISKSALQRYASGETKKIPVDVIEKIAAVTNVTARYLMGWDEPNTESAPDVTAQSAIDEPIAVKASESEWDFILDRLSDESLLMFREYARYLLWRQAQADGDNL